MRVFLAGSTGVLGGSILPLLVRDGHQVTALVRSKGQAETVHRLGADPVIAHAPDGASLRTVVVAAAPDVVMHQLTALSRADSAANADLRTRGSRNLMNAVHAAGVRRVVAQSISWAYAPGEQPAPESTPLDLAASGHRATTISGVVALEEAVAEVPEWVVLRYGTLYGPGTWFSPEGARAAEAMDGELRTSSDVTSFLHVHDAARAAVSALTWPSGAVNVCDDEPSPASEWLPVFCKVVGAPAPADGPSRRTGWARGADNSRARAELGMTLEYPSWRDGLAEMSPVS